MFGSQMMDDWWVECLVYIDRQECGILHACILHGIPALWIHEVPSAKIQLKLLRFALQHVISTIGEVRDTSHETKRLSSLKLW
jgi:hypothetical protein